MFGDEIEVPKELREFMLGGAKETVLGHKNGAQRQYRYGNLHIREYNDKFLVHSDKIDPTKNPLGHLIYDAPEVLIGLTCAAFGGLQTAKKSKHNKILSGIISSTIIGYLGYTATRKLKEHLERRHVKH